MITYSINVMKDGEETAYITDQIVYGLAGNMLHSLGNLIYHKVIIDGVDMDCDYLIIGIYYNKILLQDINFIIAKKVNNIFYGMIVNPIKPKELFFLKKIIKNGIVESFHSNISYKERLSYISAIGHFRLIRQERKNFEKELIIDADVCDWPSFLLNICHKCNFDSCITVGSAYAFMDFINDNSILWEYTNLLKFKFLDNNLRSIKKSYIDYYQENHQESCIYSLIFSSIISNDRLIEVYKSIYGGDYEIDEYDFPNKNYLNFQIKTLNDVFLAIGSGIIKKGTC